jgi:cytochrome c oxidase accessory protein FixG
MVAESDTSPFYADRVKIYPRAVKGPLRRIKWLVLTCCLALYYLAPWLRWDRGPGRPSQALLVDMPDRRAFFLGLEIWPQEIYWLAGLLILGAVTLFFVTSLFGRLWCGYACPQTVWTDLFMWAERFVEGDRMQRMRRDQHPWRAATLARKAAKHAIWLVIAAATGGAWVMYFNDAPTVLAELFTLEASSTVYLFVGLFTATTYLLAGWAREQVCTYMCPWPRFQSSMVDENTFTVTYRDWRGEPRGKHKKGESWDRHGDCVDCRACVQVCPTGIDIRDGMQLECIGCGLCIDACNEIMAHVARPKNLIAFDTYANLAAHRQGGSARVRIVRPRTIVYAGVLVVAALVMVVSLLWRETADLSVLADRSPLFVRLSDGSIRNAYTVKIVNKMPDSRAFRLKVGGLPEARLAIAGDELGEVPAEDGVGLLVHADSVGTFRAFLHVPLAAAKPEVPVKVTLIDVMGRTETARRAAVFHGPTAAETRP